MLTRYALGEMVKRDNLFAFLGAAIFMLGCSAHAQNTCPTTGHQLVLFDAGGRGQTGGPPGPASEAPVDPTSLPPQGVYAACLDEATGHLTSLGMQAQVNHASWVLVDSKKRVAYTTGSLASDMRSDGSIFSFKIDRATGALHGLGSSPSGGSDPTNLAWDPHSGTLFVANHGTGTVGVIKTGPDGGVHALSDTAQQEGSGPSPRQKRAAAHGVAVDPTGHYVLCADFGSDKLYIYHFDAATGRLTPADPAFISTPAGTGPRHVAFSPDGKYVAMDTELDGKVRVYHWHASSGTLEPGQVVDPYPPGYAEQRSAAEIQFAPNGKFFYLSLRGKEDKLLTYTWKAAQGQLAEVQRIPSLGGTPWSFGLDPSGKWMLVTNSGSGTVSVFAVEKTTGKLSPTQDPLKLPGAISVAFVAP